MPKLLVIDDEQNVLYSIQKSLESEDLQVIGALTGEQGVDVVRQSPPDAAILDLRLPDMSGMQAFEQIRQIAPWLPVVIITAFASTDTAIEAMKHGAFEYLLKPVDLHNLRDVVGRALDLSRFRHVPALFEGEGENETETESAERIVGRSRVMQEIYKTIGRVAPRDETVLITGESGTGKELVARAIFHHSNRAKAPFLALNCAAIPETLLESELFGYERGAFTGADRRRIGKFEQASGGTLFLDEIGDMSAGIQPKILRVLQEKCIERLGGNESVGVDVRLLVATNKNLEEEVAAGRFRRDLFYRLNVFSIRLPPLRERREDLPLLIEHCLRHFSRTMGRRPHTITPEAQECLLAYDWPGNIRQLQNVLKYGIIESTGGVVTLAHLPESVRSNSSAPPAVNVEEGKLEVSSFTSGLLRAGEPDIYHRVSMEFDRVLLGIVLRHTKGNQVRASDLLGISRTTLRAKLRTLGITFEKQLLLTEELAE